jgi:isoleucyl-tRNA synthetase
MRVLCMRVCASAPNAQRQTGHRVRRRFGWDCHGLPVEYEIDQTLGIKSRDDVMEMGIAT